MPYATICLKGASAVPADTVTIPEWESSTAIRSADDTQPYATFTTANAAAVQLPPAADDSPGSEIKRNTRVATILVTSNGTSGATAKTNMPTTTNHDGTGLTVNLTAAGGVVTAMTVGNNAGLGYELGDVVTVSTANAGTAAAVVGVVTWVLQ